VRCLCGESFSFVSLFFCCAQKNALLLKMRYYSLFDFDENSTYFLIFKSFDSAFFAW